MYVYAETGTATDDGKLTAPEYQANISTQVNEEAYRALYAIHANDPSHYALPRRIRLGIEFNF